MNRKEDIMKIRANIKAGSLTGNHNEKMVSNINTIEQKKTLGKKLRLSKETLRDLKDTDLKIVRGGMRPNTEHTYCGGNGCYTNNSCVTCSCTV